MSGVHRAGLSTPSRAAGSLPSPDMALRSPVADPDAPPPTRAARDRTRSSSDRSGLGSAVRALARAASWHRRLLAAVLAAIAVLAAVQVVRPAPVPLRPVAVARHDVPAGRVLTADDLRTAQVPADAVTGPVVADPASLVGRRTAGPLAAGESVTPTRLLGAGLLASFAGDLGGASVEVAVRVTDAAVLALVAPGDRVDVVTAASPDTVGDTAAAGAAADGGTTGTDTTGADSTGGDGGAGGAAGARVVAAAAPVLAVNPSVPGVDADGADAGGGDGTGVVVLAATPATALALAGATPGATVSLVLHPGV